MINPEDNIKNSYKQKKDAIDIAYGNKAIASAALFVQVYEAYLIYYRNPKIFEK